MFNEASILVINLERSKERLAFMQRQLGDHFQRIGGVLDADVPKRLRSQFSKPEMFCPGEIGCYASHLLAAEQIIVQGLPYAVILEDDITIDVDLREIAVRSAIIVDKWDFISLSGKDRGPYVKIAALGNRVFARFVKIPKATAAYMLSYSGARKLLKHRQRFRPVDIDIHFGWEMDFEAYGVFPPLAFQTGQFPSNISNYRHRFYWRSAPLNYLLGRLKLLGKIGLSGMLRLNRSSRVT